jgi:recombination protein RecT
MQVNMSEEKSPTIRSIIAGDLFKQQVALALPRHLSADRFVRVALTAITRTPKLANCDQHSFLAALLTLSQLGLEPDGRLAHLIPFENKKRGVTEVQLIVDYKGLVDLAMRTGYYSKIHADKVCEKDDFEYDMGEVKKHKVDFRNPRGEVFAYYSQVTLKDGTKVADCMTFEEVESIRKRSPSAEKGPWVTDFDEMGKKTVFRRLSKWIPSSPEFREALDADADQLEEARFRSALPAQANILPGEEEPIPQIPKFKKKEEEKTEKKAKSAPRNLTPLEKIRADLEFFNLPEKTFCQGLLGLGIVSADFFEVEELPETVIKQVASMDMAKLLEDMEAISTKPTNELELK